MALAPIGGGSTSVATTKKVLEEAIATLTMKRLWVKNATNNPVQALDALFYSTKYRILDGTKKDQGRDSLWVKYAEFLFYQNKDGLNTSETHPVFSSASLNKIILSIDASLTKFKSQLSALPVAKPTNSSSSSSGGKKPPTTTKKPAKGSLMYNVGLVKESYFTKERSNGTIETTTNKRGKTKTAFNTESENTTLFSTDGNQPVAAIAKATDLWKNSMNHKGMISNWNPPKNAAVPGADLVSGAIGGTVDPNKYAFQFHYNPQPVTMSYAGAPPVDVAQFTSGTEDYALWTGGGGNGTIHFELILNRVNDMKYYEKGKLIKKGVYSNRDPMGAEAPKTLFNEQEAIYNRGTMYDVEYLLRTVMGITIKSQFRGNTADIGWIGAMPIEVHLGPGLRYWGSLSAFTINHVMFNERMVPIFSTISITINRLPDYVSMPTSTSSQTSSTGTTSAVVNSKVKALSPAQKKAMGIG